MTRTTIRLSPAELARVRARAEAESTSTGAIVRAAIAEAARRGITVPDAPTETLSIHLSDADLEVAEMMSRQAGVTVRAWIREALRAVVK